MTISVLSGPYNKYVFIHLQKIEEDEFAPQNKYVYETLYPKNLFQFSILKYLHMRKGRCQQQCPAWCRKSFA